MDVLAKITGIKYSPFLCRELNEYNLDNFDTALSKDASFILLITEKKKIALSWWVSPKRTRSYPYARVYDTLVFQGKKVTVVPLMKDEGKDGDRDFLQWDTISLMSLLGIYTIISYYSSAEQSLRYKHKITNQRFCLSHLKDEVHKLLAYQSDALHWNLTQIDNVAEIAQKAIDSYEKISKITGVVMHSKVTAGKRISELLKGRENFMKISRKLAKEAQQRESLTIQPKEKLVGKKAKLTIENYLGGFYFFTCDEAIIEKNTIYLIEGKHSKQNLIPSLEDIKDGLVKMILFTNLREIKVEDKEYSPISILKLTSGMNFSERLLKNSQLEQLLILKNEAEINCFNVLINNKDLQNIEL